MFRYISIPLKEELLSGLKLKNIALGYDMKHFSFVARFCSQQNYFCNYLKGSQNGHCCQLNVTLKPSGFMKIVLIEYQ